jgi:hypothetical protein
MGGNAGLAVKRFHREHRRFFSKGIDMSIPVKDAVLVPWIENFTTRIQASPTTFGLQAPQAAELYARKQAFVNAYNAMMNARADGTRSKAQTETKDDRKTKVVTYARELYALISANKSVSNADKTLVGVHVRDTKPSPIHAPTVRPGMIVKAVVGRTVSTTIHESASSAKRRKPKGAVQAYVYWFVGEDYPSDPNGWRFAGPANKADFNFTVPNSVASGAQVWICAAWVNRKGDAGPVSVPISTNVQGGGAAAGEGELKIAA